MEFRYLTFTHHDRKIRAELHPGRALGNPRVPTWLLLALLLAACMSTAIAGEILTASQSVVRLHVTSQGWDFGQPWKRDYPQDFNCSGFFITEGILTSSHCVADAKVIDIEFPDQGKKQRARVKAVNHQVDLALLALDDPSLNRPPIELDGLPHHLDTVIVTGYPIGGTQVSHTKGVISRIDVLPYVQSNLNGMLVQVDAAINSGNSGGPVFSEPSGKVVGVATQNLENSSLIGYFVPVPVIRQFLDDIRDGRVDGVTNLGIGIQSMENPGMREYLGMPADTSGVRVSRVSSGGSAEGYLHVDDILLALDGHALTDSGEIYYRDKLKININYVFTRKQVGDPLKVELLREGQRLSLTIPLKPYLDTILPSMPLYDRQPPYKIVGGLVFMPLTRNHLDLYNAAGISIPPEVGVFEARHPQKGGVREIVLLVKTLNAPVNAGYDDNHTGLYVRSVNARPVIDFDDFSRKIDQALDKGGFLTVEFDSNETVRLKVDEVKRADPEIKVQYGIE
jgi:S1-C subfamily serine protease